MQSFFGLFNEGGFVMYPLLLCSAAVWWIIFERGYRYYSLKRDLMTFQVSAAHTLLRGDSSKLNQLCQHHSHLPTARLMAFAIERLQSNHQKLRNNWQAALERQRQVENQNLRRYLWILGTVGSAAPFIGLFGTVVGILRSFGDIAESGKGGFAIVAAGISEALIATAAGIIVAVIAVMAFNAFQTRWAELVLLIRNHTDEIKELLDAQELHSPGGSTTGGS